MNKLNKIIFLLLLTISLVILSATVSQARIITNDPTVKSGETVTINVTSQEKLLGYKVGIKSNSGLTFKSVTGGTFTDGDSVYYTSMAPTTDVATYTFKAPEVTKEATYTVTFSAEGVIIQGNDDEETEFPPATATVTVEPITTSSGGNSGGSGNSSGSNGSSSGSSSTSIPKISFTSKNETVYSTTDGLNVRSNYSTTASPLGSLDEGESVTRTGIAEKKDSEGILWSKVTFGGKTGYVSSAYLTTTKPVVKVEEKDEEQETDKEKDKQEEENKKEEKSNSTKLKTFEVTPTGLSPAFSENVTEYTMTVGSDVEEIKINAVAEHEKAKVSISGNKELEIGTNTIKIKVTAEDGTEKTYVITVTKEEKEQLKLTELLVDGLPLDPKFDENVYEYTIDLDRSDISKLNITATPNEREAEIEIVGNTELKPGENVITILVKSSNGEEITTYQITANIPEMVKDIAIVNNKDLYKYVGIGIAVLALLIIIVIVIKKSKKKNDEEDAKYYEMYNLQKEENTEDEEIIEKPEEIKFEDLPKLDEEELPKYLRKEKVKEEIKEENEVLTEEQSKVTEEEETFRSKKIEELYAMSGEETPRKRGKHF